MARGFMTIAAREEGMAGARPWARPIASASRASAADGVTGTPAAKDGGKTSMSGVLLRTTRAAVDTPAASGAPMARAASAAPGRR